MRKLLPHLFAMAAVLCALAAFVPFVMGMIVILAASGGEYRGVLSNDRPNSYHLLAFGPWHDGAGDLRPSEIHLLPESAKITKHRVGRADGSLTRFTYYEADYQFTDGSRRVTHASGPVEMISLRKGRVNAWFGLCALLAIVLIVFAFRYERQSEGS